MMEESLLQYPEYRRVHARAVALDIVDLTRSMSGPNAWKIAELARKIQRAEEIDIAEWGTSPSEGGRMMPKAGGDQPYVAELIAIVDHIMAQLGRVQETPIGRNNGLWDPWQGTEDSELFLELDAEFRRRGWGCLREKHFRRICSVHRAEQVRRYQLD